MKKLWVFLGTLFFLTSVQAQNFPNKPLRIIVPFPAGGIVDLMARAFSDRLAASLGQPVLIEARPGANGSLGTEAVAKADPDGYTLVLATLSHSAYPALAKSPWHPVRDFAGVARIGHVANIALVSPAVPAKNLRELVDAAKAQPGKINYVNAGTGTSQTLTIELLKRNTGIDLVGIGYKGYPPAIPDLISGEVQFAFVPFAVAAPQLRSGKLRAIAIAAPARSKQFPDLPTMAEAGYGDSQVISWYALLAPAATPRAIVARLNAETNKALADAEVAGRIDKLGGEVLALLKPEEVDAMVAREYERWTKLVQATGLKID
jgi:tripartite-type tricarboxylate transporter receptor subunit TctC